MKQLFLLLPLVTLAYANEPPALENTAYVLMDHQSGQILAQKNAQSPLPPASLTKMMTSYIIEQRLLDGSLQEEDLVLMSENAWCEGRNDQSCMYVPVNTKARVIDLLRGIIIQSGNDASIAMAEHMAGSEDAFSALMNHTAQSLGMTQSHFVNATGMPQEGHVSSALDMAKLARAIIQEGDRYYKLYAEQSFTFNGITQGNRNVLLGDDGVDGLKTGHTQEAGFCLAASSVRDNMRLIAVIMGAPSMSARAEQARALLDYGYDTFHLNHLVSKDQAVGNVSVRYGKAQTVQAVAFEPLAVVMPKDAQDAPQVITEIDTLTAPIQQGQVIGKLHAIRNGTTLTTVPLVAAVDVPEASFLGRLWQQIVGFFS